MRSAAPTQSTADQVGLPAVLGGFDLTDQARFADGIPYDVFAALRRDARVLLHPAGHTADGESFWVLSRHADIAAAAADPAFSAQTGGDRTGGGTHLDDLAMGVHAGALLPMMDDPRHDLIARLVGPCVSRRAVAEVEAELAATAVALTESALQRGHCAVPSQLTGPFAAEAMALVLGIPRPDRAQVASWLAAVVGIVSRRSGVADEATRETNLAIHRYCKELLAAKRAAPGDDLTSVIATGEIAATAGLPPLTEHEREINFLLFLQTGSEQPRNTLAGGLLAFADHPQQWQALRADRSLLPTAIEEIVRWTPPNPYNRRTAVRDVEFAGARIRAGDKVTLWWASANRDETVFVNPSAFDISRNPNPHLSFGYGPHRCLGDHLTRVQLRILLTALLDRVEEIQLLGPPKWSPSNKHTVFADLPVRLVPHRG
jgi:cytochrome P450